MLHTSKHTNTYIYDMKTAEEILGDYDFGPGEDIEALIKVMRTYAKQVAGQALKDAVDGSKIKAVDYGSFGIASYEYEVDKELILSTPIKTP